MSLFSCCGHRLAAGQLPALVDKRANIVLEVFWVGRLGRLEVALQPLLSGGIAPPAGKLGRETNLLPLRMVAGLEQCRETAKECLNEVCNVGGRARRALREIGGHKHRTHRDGID